MAKKTTVVAQSAPANDDGRLEYSVAEGISIVNGRKVAGGIVRLTVAEALYDLSLGRISLIAPVAESGNGGS